MKEYTFRVPADYGCLAILDPENYSSFVSENWTLDGLKKHFIEQNICGSLVSWGCSYENLTVKLVIGSSNESGFQSFISGFKSNGNILLTTYESLTMAAQFEDIFLPEAHEREQVIQVEPGNYRIKVVQLFRAEQAESDKVFNQNEPNYIIALEQVHEQIAPVKEVPWFAGC